MRKLILMLLLTIMPCSLAQAEQMGKNVELLVSSCAACHGTNGHSVGGTPMLAGLAAEHFIEQMSQFKTGDRRATIMSHHASGYTMDEIRLMAMFFAQQNK